MKLHKKCQVYWDVNRLACICNDCWSKILDRWF